MYCSKKEKVASECLVICVGIAKYAKETGIPNINDVCDDIQAYKCTFAENNNYTLISNDYNKIYSKQALLNYFTLLFDENLYDSSTNGIAYNSLIITISGHCTENSLIVSTGEKIQFVEILSVFTESFKNKNLIINLPKFVIIDGQRGYDYVSLLQTDEKQMDDIAYIEAQMMGGEDEYITDLYAAIMCSVSTNLDATALSGQLAWNFTQIIADNIKNQTDIIFYDIVKQLRHRINKALDDYQFSVDFIEHDMDIDDVIFKAAHQMKMKLKPVSSANNKDKNKKKSHFNRSASLGNILNLKKEKKKKKEKKSKDKQKKSSPLSPRKFFKRTQSLTSSFSGKRCKSQPPNKNNNNQNKQATFAFPEDEEINDIKRDQVFKDTIEWNKTIEILSKTKDKTRVRIEWLFILDCESHTISLLHSQKLHNPYIKSKRVLSIDGKQIWSHKSTKTQFIDMFNANVVQINLDFDENNKEFNYRLKINQKTHKQLFKKWNQKQINSQYVE